MTSLLTQQQQCHATENQQQRIDTHRRCITCLWDGGQHVNRTCFLIAAGSALAHLQPFLCLRWGLRFFPFAKGMSSAILLQTALAFQSMLGLVILFGKLMRRGR